MNTVTILLAMAPLSCGLLGEDGDTTPPQVVITHPTTGDTIASNIEVTYTVLEDGELSRFLFYVDGEYVGFATPEDLTWTWEALPWADGGTHALEVRAIDKAKNAGSATVTILVATPQLPVQVSYPDYTGDPSLFRFVFDFTERLRIETVEFHRPDKPVVIISVGATFEAGEQYVLPGEFPKEGTYRIYADGELFDSFSGPYTHILAADVTWPD